MKYKNKKNKIVIGGRTAKGNDFKKINLLLEKGIYRPRPGVLIHLRVQHDDWCLSKKSGGVDPCNCDPNIIMEEQITGPL